MQSYLDCLDEELSKQPGFKKPQTKMIKKRRTTSKTDPDSRCINHGTKSGIGYLMETTVDCKYGIITGVDVNPANEKESLLVLQHLEQQIKRGFQCKAFHWIVATIPVLFIAVWSYWALQDTFQLFAFPTLWKSMTFSIYPKKMRFVAPKALDLFTKA